MERLTKRTAEGIAYLANVKQDEQVIEGSRNTLQCLYDSWQKLAEYEDKIEVGDLIKVVRCKDCKYWESIDQNIITHSRCEHPSKDKIKTRAEDTCEFAEGYRSMTEDEYSEGVGSLIEDWGME